MMTIVRGMRVATITCELEVCHEGIYERVKYIDYDSRRYACGYHL